MTSKSQQHLTLQLEQRFSQKLKDNVYLKQKDALEKSLKMLAYSKDKSVITNFLNTLLLICENPVQDDQIIQMSQELKNSKAMTNSEKTKIWEVIDLLYISLYPNPQQCLTVALLCEALISLKNNFFEVKQSRNSVRVDSPLQPDDFLLPVEQKKKLTSRQKKNEVFLTDEMDFVAWMSNFISGFMLYLAQHPVAHFKKDRHKQIERLLLAAEHLLSQRDIPAIDRAFEFMQEARTYQKSTGAIANLIIQQGAHLLGQGFFHRLTPLEICQYQKARLNYQRSRVNEDDIRKKILTPCYDIAKTWAHDEASKGFMTKLMSWFSRMFKRTPEEQTFVRLPMEQTLRVRLEDVKLKSSEKRRASTGERQQLLLEEKRNSLREIATHGAHLAYSLRAPGDNYHFFPEAPAWDDHNLSEDDEPMIEISLDSSSPIFVVSSRGR